MRRGNLCRVTNTPLVKAHQTLSVRTLSTYNQNVIHLNNVSSFYQNGWWWMFSAEPQKLDAPLEADVASRRVSQHPGWRGGGLCRTLAGAGFDPGGSVRNVSVLMCTNQCSQWATKCSWGSSLQPDSSSRRLIFSWSKHESIKNRIFFFMGYIT